MKFELHGLQSGTWADPETPKASRRPSSVFKVSWRQVLHSLDDETAKIGLAGPVIIEIGVQDYDIRQDRQGLLSGAGRPYHPGAVVSFESKKHGPMRYATDAYDSQPGHGSASLLPWQANVRAVTLTLEALRGIARWGVASSGQQYAGWAALPAGGRVTFPSADAALRWMMTRVPEGTAPAASARELYRVLAAKLHPDAAGSGADPEDWDRLQSARLLLQSANIL